MKKVSVVLVDDHTLVRKGLRAAITADPNIEVIAEASTAEELLSFLEKSSIDIVVTDISMPGMSGLNLCKIVNDKYPDTNVLILSMHKDPEYIVKAFEAGAMGYLTKDSDESEFHNAIKKINQGSKYLSPYVAEVLATQFVSKDSDSGEEKLTSRESEVLSKIVEGQSNKQIAEDLFISARTVDTHRTNMMRKLKAHNAAELVRVAILQKLV
ncbi:MAG: response regulator transcription factor [Cyclobacteriaceae bacterium]